MLYPSIDKLMDKEPSKYSLVILASKRAHQLQVYDNKLLDTYYSQTPLGMALEEIVAGKLKLRSED